MKFYPHSKQGRKGLSHAEGAGVGGTQGFEVVLTWELEALAILKEGGGAKSCEVVLTLELQVLAILKEGAQTVFPCLEDGGGPRSFTPAFFPFCSTPPPSLAANPSPRRGISGTGSLSTLPPFPQLMTGL